MAKRFPCFLQTENKITDEHIYGLPSNEYPGLVKVRPGTGKLPQQDSRLSLVASCMIISKFYSFLLLENSELITDVYFVNVHY